MKPILTYYDVEEEGGFYYDIQRKNPLQKISLHANSIPPVDPYADWISWSSGEKHKDVIDPEFRDTTDAEGKNWVWTEENCFLESAENLSPTSKGLGHNPQYGRQSLCNAILTEDFGVTISNNWGNFSAGQSLEDTYNSFRIYEPYLGKAVGLFSKMAEGISEYQTTVSSSVGTNNTSFSNIMGKAVNFLKGVSSNGTRVLRRSLVVQGTRFSYYSGTGISFSNLGMKFTLFPDYFNGVFKTVEEQLKTIIPYSVGKYVNFIGDKGSAGGYDNTTTKDGDLKTDNNASFLNYALGTDVDIYKKDEKGNSIAGEINQYLGWQMPPGGFHATIENIDYIQSGTLMLKLGTHYCLKNLVIQEIQLNYSKHFAKFLDPNDKSKIKTCPMYCDVFITFTPANKYSDKKLKEFVLSNTDNEVKVLESRINIDLNQIIDFDYFPKLDKWGGDLNFMA